jgi:hypothetical protein
MLLNTTYASAERCGLADELIGRVHVAPLWFEGTLGSMGGSLWPWHVPLVLSGFVALFLIVYFGP